MDDQTTLLITYAVIISITVLTQILFKAIRVSAVIGYVALGFGIRILAHWINFTEGGGSESLMFLGELGIVILLFRIRLESEPKELLRQLRTAGWISACDVIISFMVAYLAAYYILGVSQITSLIIGAALMATSVGIPRCCMAAARTIEDGRR